MRKIVQIRQSCHRMELLSVSLFLRKKTLMVLENVIGLFPFFPGDSSSVVPSSDNSSSATFSESSDYISLKNKTSSSNDINLRARNIPKLVTVANALKFSSTIDEGITNIDIENEDEVITPEQLDIENPSSKCSSDLNQISPPLIPVSYKNIEISTAFHMSKLLIRL